MSEITVKIKPKKDGSKEFDCSSVDSVFDEGKSKTFNFTLSLNQLGETSDLKTLLGSILQYECTFKSVESELKYNFDSGKSTVTPIDNIIILPMPDSKKRKKL